MPSHKEFQEKIDVLDIIISILKDHEESLSKIADRFDGVCSEISTFEEKASVLDRALDHIGGQKIKNIIGAIGTKGPLVTVNCKSWQAFKGASQGALLVAYEVLGEQAFFSSISDLFVFTFSGELNETSIFIKKSARQWLDKNLESDDEQVISPGEITSTDGESAYKTLTSTKMIKRWLSTEMSIPEERIVEGRVIC
jgi:hypothetical protein